MKVEFVTHSRLSNTEAFTHRSLYTQIYTDTFYTRRPSHTDAFTHRQIYTQNRNLYRQNRKLYTQTLLHTDTLHTDVFTNRRFYTQVCAQTLLHK